MFFLDGLQLGDHRVVAAVGVTEWGEKRVLGLWEGVTENREVCQALMEDLAARELLAEQGLLVVIDGSFAAACAAPTSSSRSSPGTTRWPIGSSAGGMALKR
ncbi:transposase [Geochorda subterranea]|uniref:transposase n=1 Tax=Geochorda subterranea TaxID=3109564 RepID=UPI0038601E30